MVQKRPKIAFIHPDLGIGGAERLIIDMANALVDKNDIIFLTNHFDPQHAFDELKNDCYNVHVYGDWIPRSIFGKCQALCAYMRMIYLTLVYLLFYKKTHKVDLYVVDLIPIAIPFLKFAGEKVIYYCHHPDLLATTRENILKELYRKPLDWLECKATKTSNIILVNSKYTASIFQRTFPEIGTELQVLYPTISSSVVELLSSSVDSIQMHSLIQKIPEDSIVFLSINRFHPAKKLEMAIEAMSHLKTVIRDSKWRSVYLVIAGGYDPNSAINASYFEVLNELTQHENLEEKIIYLKSPSESMKVKLLQACHCLIYTPIKEHFGIVPLEAMMAEKPVIACNSGGPRETVEHGKNGYLCEPNSKSLAEYMGRIVNDGNFKQMGQNGKERLQTMFSNELFTKNLRNIVENAIKN